MADLYSILGVSRTASAAELRAAYRRLARVHHPDRNKGGEDRFKMISQAYSVLSDERQRAAYDRGEAPPALRPAASRPEDRRVRVSKERLLTRDRLNDLYGDRMKEILETLRRNVRRAGYWVSTDVLRKPSSMMPSRHFYVARDQATLVGNPEMIAIHLDLYEELLSVIVDLRHSHKGSYVLTREIWSLEIWAVHSQVSAILWDLDQRKLLRRTLDALGGLVPRGSSSTLS